MTHEQINQLAATTLDAAFTVHRQLGPGLLESTYKACLAYELQKHGLTVQLEVPVAVVYDGQKLADVGYRIDILVNSELILEIKAIESIAPVHKAQLLSYLKLANKRLGLLLNFNVAQLKDGIFRRVNGL